MSRERREVDIGWEGRRTRVNDLSSLNGRKVARRLMTMLGKTVREIATSSSSLLDLDVKVLGMIGGAAMLEQLDDDTMNWLTATFMEVTEVEREAGSDDYVKLGDVHELAFRGADGLVRWMRWLTFCVESSCGAFFADAFAQLQRLAPRQMATSVKVPPSPSTSSTPGNITA